MGAASDTRVRASPSERAREAERPEQPRAWNVVLLDDDDHTYEYVIEMVGILFAADRPRGMLLARAVDTQGRVVCLTTHKEHAELKRDQILAYGKDWRLARCAGSMSAIIEPAEDDGASP